MGEHTCRNRWCAESEFAERLGGHTGATHAVIMALARSGIRTLAQIHAMTDADLLKIPGISKKTIRRLRGTDSGHPGQ